ncbi:sugar-binding protein [Colwellia sp. 1_MG-2023]|uniref:sugar-binding protein n=1 Tax=Colwellia sp. 1_MG-2023 TaxID=3062649 RepID=UPI0026E3D991|nr:sugar-binding protein [Colwellia sp. 1_MG-2023]MDO6447555.1 sugar-binding protein [Colwellia sp. 1_MG-2023]
MKSILILISLVYLFTSPHALAMKVPKAHTAPVIDGQSQDPAWQKGEWHELSELIVGSQPSEADFSGRFKMVWDKEKLYLLVEITDDILFDQHANPLHFYWDDDCIEIFIDEDASGGNHQFNFNAFAYHVALDNQAIDIGYKNSDGSPDFLALNNHINNKWQRSSTAPHVITWELAVDVYDDSFTYTKNKAQQPEFIGKPVKLHNGKKLGFMLAYCDNDGSKEREHFIGSTPITAVNGDKNLGYITADVFETIELIDN